MKKIDYYMGLPYRVVIVPAEEGGYVAHLPELKGCITQAETFVEVGEMIQDAKKCWIECALDEGIDIPEPEKDEAYSGKFNLRMPKTLHKELVSRAKSENVSLNQLATYLIARGLGSEKI